MHKVICRRRVDSVYTSFWFVRIHLTQMLCATDDFGNLFAVSGPSTNMFFAKEVM